jgi:predicted DCC family thiol-disulfide oxidoreductase YuxK
VTVSNRPLHRLGLAPLLAAYYDGSCGLCSAEVAELSRLDTHGDIRFIDCAAADFDETGPRPELDGRSLRAEGFSRADLMGAMHVHDVLGDWHRGVDGIALLYATVGAPWLARAWAHPLTRPVTQRVYPWVVRHRHQLSALGLNLVAPRVLRLFARRHLEHRADTCAGGQCAGEAVGGQPAHQSAAAVTPPTSTPARSP